MNYERFLEALRQIAPTMVIGLVCYIAGVIVAIIQMKKLWHKRLLAAGGCPRCVQFHALARHARKLVGVRIRSLSASGPDAEAVRNAVNGIAREAEWLPPPINGPIPLRREVSPKEVPRG